MATVAHCSDPSPVNSYVYRGTAVIGSRTGSIGLHNPQTIAAPTLKLSLFSGARHFCPWFSMSNDYTATTARARSFRQSCPLPQLRTFLLTLSLPTAPPSPRLLILETSFYRQLTIFIATSQYKHSCQSPSSHLRFSMLNRWALLFSYHSGSGIGAIFCWRDRRKKNRFERGT